MPRGPQTSLFPILTLTAIGLIGCAGEDRAHDPSQQASTTGVDPTAGSAGDMDTDTDTPEPADDDDAGSTGAEEMKCGESEFVLDAVPPNVVLVLDKSGSMVRSTWDADGDPGTSEETRWHSLHDVVSSVVGSFDEDVNFGAVLFPSVEATDEFNSNACVVSDQPEVPVAPQNANGVLGGIPSSGAGTDTVRGATPATAALSTALDHLEDLDESVDRYMILVTDGAANCSSQFSCSGVGCGLIEEYDTELQGAVGTAFAEHQVPTFVVGIDIIDEMVGTEPTDGVTAANTYQELNAVAQAGGRAREGSESFYNARNETELMDALAAIAGQVVSCTVPLDSEPVHPDYIEIAVGGETYSAVSDCESEDGWVYVNPDGPYDAVRLCGAACDALAETKSLNALFGCPPEG